MSRRFPVIETFGPTIQGEGSLAGLPTYFVRFGGCDFRCSWCDSMHAVEPAQVKANAELLTAAEITERILELPAGPEWVTLSGGNPAMLKLEELNKSLFAAGFKTAVETQGTLWKDWLAEVDVLTISPKPPSSGMTEKQEAALPDFMTTASLERVPRGLDALKIVVFDEVDLQWALGVFRTYPTWRKFLSVGTVVGEHAYDTLERMQWLMARVSVLPEGKDVRVLPQLHVLAWGHVQGV